MCTYKMVYLLTFSYILYRKTNILNFYFLNSHRSASNRAIFSSLKLSETNVKRVFLFSQINCNCPPHSPSYRVFITLYSVLFST